MSSNYEYYYKPALSTAEKRLKQLKKSQWNNLVHNDLVSVYANDKQQPSSFKVSKQLKAVNLEEIYSVLSTINLRTQWCQLFKDINVIAVPLSNISILKATPTARQQSGETLLVERTEKKTNHVTYISTSFSTTTPTTSCTTSDFFIACQVESRFDMAHVTLYCQSDLVTPEALTLLVNNLVDIHLFGWISHYDHDIEIVTTKLTNTTLQLDYQFKQKLLQQAYTKSQPMSINTTATVQRRFQSGSWDQKSHSIYQLEKNMSSSHLASASFLYKGEEGETITPEKEVRIQVMDHPNINLCLPDHPEESNRFAQMCLNCYYNTKNGYIIQLIHPIQFMQYFIKNNNVSYFRAHLTIEMAEDRKCHVNHNNWPVRPSFLLPSNEETVTDEDEEDEDEEEEEEEEEDIFVDGMESFKPQMETKQDVPTLRPSHSTPVPSTLEPSEPLERKSESDIIVDYSDETTHEIKIPDSEPLAIRQIYPRFIEYLHTNPQSILQQPTLENGNVTISRIDVPNHPMGALITTTIWNHCSIWDVKAVLETAQKVWDPLFEDTQLVSSSSRIWHTKRRGTWLFRAYDAVCFHSEYKSEHSIDLCSTSCPSSYQHKELPKPMAGYARARVDLKGTRLKKMDPHTVSMESALLMQLPSSWLSLPPTIGSLVSQCAVVQHAKTFFETHGAPPSIEDMYLAMLLDTTYDHDGKSWRCEYTRHDTQTTGKPSKVHIRLDKRRWAHRYSVVIDPPPSRYTAMEKREDGFGIWLTIEHDEAFIIPLCGKILVLIKPDDGAGENVDKPISINGVSIPVVATSMEEEERLPPSYSENFLLDELAENKTVTPNKAWVMDHASTVFSFLKHTDEQFGWTVISDNVKTGTRICKKSGTKSTGGHTNNATNVNQNKLHPTNSDSTNKKEEENETTILNVPEPFMIYKATKVIENFSMDEVISAVTDIDQIRRAYDDTIDAIELYRQVEPGCRIVRQSAKAIFPFKSRDLYTCTCLAQESSAMQPTKRTFYIESSLPDYAPNDVKRPVGNLFISGWILEPVDPYTTTTNHPIPSTRVCHVTALDLSVPSYISNLVANSWSQKKIMAVEGFLKSKTPSPYLVQPTSPLVFSNNTLSHEPEGGFSLKETQTTYDRRDHVYRVVNQWSVKSTTDRRPSLAETMYRRGSLPGGLLKKRIGPAASKVVLECRVDLRSYPRGYEMTCHLWDMTEFKRDLTGKLTVLVTELPLSMNSSRNMHTILMTAEISLAEDATLELEFELMPAGEEAIQRRGLTVSGVLGEEDSKDGVMLMNGKMLRLGKDTVLDYVQEYDIDREEVRPLAFPLLELKTVVEDNTIDSAHQTDGHDGTEPGEEEGKREHEGDDTSSNGIQYIGGGVVATAIGNVSAGVNNLSARMMIPFRAASQTFLSKDEGVIKEEASNTINLSDSEEEEEEEEDDDDGHFTRTNTDSLHEVRVLRKSSDTMKKGMLLMFICCGLSIVLALLLLQFMLERYYTSFTVSSTLSSLDESVEKGIVHRLIQIPWFGGWNIQLIAVRPNM